MSEKKGPFDAVLEFLNGELEYRERMTKARVVAIFRPLYAEKTESIRQAIRVLEAAGRVDKEEAIKWINGTCHSSATTPSKANWIATHHLRVRALLESLPDGKEKK